MEKKKKKKKRRTDNSEKGEIQVKDQPPNPTNPEDNDSIKGQRKKVRPHLAANELKKAGKTRQPAQVSPKKKIKKPA